MRDVSVESALRCVRDAILAGVRWGFSPCVFRGWLFFGKFWLLMLSGAMLSTVLITHTHVFSFLKCPMKTMVDAREIHMSFATFVPTLSRPWGGGGGGARGGEHRFLKWAATSGDST